MVVASVHAAEGTGQFAAPAHASTTGARPHLLLIHGLSDNCAAAFNQVGVNGQAPDTTTENFLTSQAGGGWTAGDITTVGYYTWDGMPSQDTCNINLNYLAAENSPAAADASKCSYYESISGDVGTINDRLFHLACEFAWYIYDTYTKNSIPVEIVAHSMGGLITRAAIGATSQQDYAYFPPAPLLVTNVVTVATPHGGVGGSEQTAGWWTNNGSLEIADMGPGSVFMNAMGTAQFEKPQGSTGTHWALIGSSVPSSVPTATTFQGQTCGNGSGITTSWSLGRAASCLVAYWDNDAYPDGDGTVQSLSALAMAADYKVLYGSVEQWIGTSPPSGTLYVADPTKPTYTMYEHEGGPNCATSQDMSQIFGPSQVCAMAPFYLNDGSTLNDASAFVCLSSCNTTADFGDVHLTSPVHNFPHSLAVIASQLVPPQPSQWVVGHAAHAGNDYPYETLGQFEHLDEGADAWNEFYGQCDSFAAWKVYENLAGSSVQLPSSVPAPGWTPSNAWISPVNQYTWGPNGGPFGNADVWASKFSSLGYQVNNVPTPGAIAWWPNAVTDTQDNNPPDPVHGIGNFGHVGYVSDVYPDGSVNIESYNMRLNGQYSIVHLTYNESFTDNSFSQPNFTVPWPGGFIHVADGAANPTPTQPAPSGPGVLDATYPGDFTNVYNTSSSSQHGLTVIGPDDVASTTGSPDFTLAGSAYPNTVHGWYSDPGHGEIGQMLWTNTHAGAADSTATWTPILDVGSCYRLDAFVPNNWSNNDAAVYTVQDYHFGTSLVPVDENATTNDWVELGVFQATTSGSIPVKLTDQGSGTGQIAADAMRYLLQPNCNGLVRASQTIDYGSGMQLAGQSFSGTVYGWYQNSPSGQFGHDLYTYTNGMKASSSATWTANVIPNACYQLFAYVPSNHANDYQAMYTVSAAAGAPTVSVDENSYGNAFADVGTYRATSTGEIMVTLTDQSLASGDAYVAADSLSFVQTSCSGPVEGAVYPSSLTVGPGSPLANFSLVSDWYNRFGHGDLGYEKWTYSNGTTAVSKATWIFTGLSNGTQYTVCAFIPDNYANNPDAHYQGFDGNSTTITFDTTLNQANLSGWTYLGLLWPDNSGNVRVTLDDTGTVGTYTAADAMRLTTGNSC